MASQSNLGAISIARASKDDLPSILNLFDEAVIWLNQRGIDKQWGTGSFSASPKRHEQFMGWIEREAMFVACLDEHIVGSVALNPAPPVYVANRWERFPSSAFYLEAFATSRALTGRGIGRAILHWAELECGKATIWLDCWGENDALVRYYQQMGFVPRGEFRVEKWRGQLFEKQISQEKPLEHF